MQRRSLVFLAAAALLAAGCDKLKPGGAPASFTSTDITGADYANKLALPDVDGKLRSLDEWKGKIVVVFFGYAQCPDVCPATLAELAAARRELGPDGAKVQVVFVTVDPVRDTPEILKAYVANFGTDVVALRGSLEQVKQTARDFKVYFAQVPGKTEGSYTVDHTAGSFIFDTQGRIRLFARFGGDPKALLADLRTLMAQA